MERPHEHPRRAAGHQRLHALLHLARGLVSEGEREDVGGQHVLVLEDLGDAVGQHARLPGACAGEDQARALRLDHGFFCTSLSGSLLSFVATQPFQHQLVASRPVVQAAVHTAYRRRARARRLRYLLIGHARLELARHGEAGPWPAPPLSCTDRRRTGSSPPPFRARGLRQKACPPLPRRAWIRSASSFLRVFRVCRPGPMHILTHHSAETNPARLSRAGRNGAHGRRYAACKPIRGLQGFPVWFKRRI